MQLSPPGLQALQLVEAQWVQQEKQECIKLIQQYRSLYLTAVLLAVSWLLGHVIGQIGASNAASLAVSQLRERVDIATLLCIIPFLNALFAMLLFEKLAEMQSLSRYLFLLGLAVHRDTPPWRWELWRRTTEGSTHAWTARLNAYFTLIALSMSIAALLFPWPAMYHGPWALRGVWTVALLVTVWVVIAAVRTGLENRHRNAVADPATTGWDDLSNGN